MISTIFDREDEKKPLVRWTMYSPLKSFPVRTQKQQTPSLRVYPLVTEPSYIRQPLSMGKHVLTTMFNVHTFIPRFFLELIQASIEALLEAPIISSSPCILYFPFFLLRMYINLFLLSNLVSGAKWLSSVSVVSHVWHFCAFI